MNTIEQFDRSSYTRSVVDLAPLVFLYEPTSKNSSEQLLVSCSTCTRQSATWPKGTIPLRRTARRKRPKKRRRTRPSESLLAKKGKLRRVLLVRQRLPCCSCMDCETDACFHVPWCTNAPTGLEREIRDLQTKGTHISSHCRHIGLASLHLLRIHRTQWQDH